MAIAHPHTTIENRNILVTFCCTCTFTDTFSNDETNRPSLPQAKVYVLPANGNLSSAFVSTSLIRLGSLTDTSS
jgi:hypothetical protein